MTKRNDILIEEHSVKSLFDKLDKIHAETKRTNGRVTELERKSWGLWISNNPFKFVGLVLILFTLLVSDSRDLIINYLIKIFI